MARREPGVQFSAGRDEEGWTIFEPSPDTRVVYVSNSGGSDLNKGLSDRTPVRTLAKGKSLLRDGFPDWLLLKKGDVWTDQSFGYWSRSGRSERERMLIGAYGKGERPLVKPASGQHGFATNTGFSNVAMIGIELYAYTRDPENPAFMGNEPGPRGIWYLDRNESHRNFLVEDTVIRMFSHALTLQDQGGTPFVNFKFRRSMILDCHANGGSVGMFFYGVDGIFIEESVFDHNGWYGNRDTGGGVGSVASYFNHDIYVHNMNPNANVPNTRDNRERIIVTGNIFSNSSEGVNLRAGGTFEDNLSIRSPIPLMIGRGDDYDTNNPDGVDATVRNNVILEGNDVRADQPRGFGVWLVNIRSCLVEGNVIAHSIASPVNTMGIPIGGRRANPSRGIVIRGNTFYKWRQGAVKLFGEGYISIDSEENNNYWDAATCGWPVTGTNRNSENLSFVEPDRSVANYNATMGGDGSFEAFIGEVRRQSKDNWRTEYSAHAINDYIRQGFERKTTVQGSDAR
jgi:hypothetical protein